VKRRPVRRTGKASRKRYRFWTNPTVVVPSQRQRFRRRWLKVIGYLCLGIGTAYSVNIGHENLVYSSVFQVQHIETAGLNRLIEKDLVSLVGVNPSARLFDVDLEGVKDRLLSHPWIREVQVRKTFPDTVKIRVSERRPVVLVEEGDRRVLVDETGKVLEEVSSAGATTVSFNETFKEEGAILPILLGIEIKALQRNEHNQYLVFQQAIDLIKIIESESQTVPGALIIDVRRGKGMVVERNGYRILFGQKEFQKKWERFLSVETDMRKRKIEIEEVDLRFPGQVIVR
jgi:cell division protein FtsQ